jgi:penicillin-binding protein 1A
MLIGGFAALGAGAGMYMGIIKNAKEISSITVMPDIYSSKIVDLSGRETTRLKGEENRVYILYDDMCQDLLDAFVAIEDERFYSHSGIDFKGIVRAGYTALESGFEQTQGASTITQQLIKNNVMKLTKNTVITKLQEQYLAIKYEKLMVEANTNDKKKAKDKILEIYANTIYLGHDYYGVMTAAKNYFNKEVKDLSLSECAVIAAITQNPVKYRPDYKPEDNRKRQESVLDKMLELGMITTQEYNYAMNDDVYSRVKQPGEVESASRINEAEDGNFHSYFDDALIKSVVEDLQKSGYSKSVAYNMLYNGGLTIVSTQDQEIQGIMDKYLRDDNSYPADLYKTQIQYYLTTTNRVTGDTKNLEFNETLKSTERLDELADEFRQKQLEPNDDYVDRRMYIPQPQAAMVVMDYHTGAVKGLNSGRGDKEGNLMFNRAVEGARQPGSVFKILAAYAPALEDGLITPSTLIKDEPFSYGGKQFSNWWGSGYRGYQTVRAGIVQSMNILAVKTMVNTGLDRCFKFLLDLGFTTLVEEEWHADGKKYTDIGAATALGGLTKGVTILETTAAYGAIANSGNYIKPYLYKHVLDHDGNVILENPNEERVVMKKSTAYMLTDMMQEVITGASGTGKRAKFENVDMPIAGKTGTTSATKDLTFVGFTPYYVAGIWFGYDIPETMDGSGSYQLPIWRKVMEEIHQNLEYMEFQMPLDSVAEVGICMDSGLIATDLCMRDGRGSRAIYQIFERGKEPTETCNVHTVVTYDTSTGMRASEFCPVEYRRTITGVVVADDNVSDWSYQIAESIYNGPTCIYHTGYRSQEPFTFSTPNPNQWQPSETQPPDYVPTEEPPTNPADYQFQTDPPAVDPTVDPAANPVTEAPFVAPSVSEPTVDPYLQFPESPVYEHTEEPTIRLDDNPEMPTADSQESIDNFFSP